jgi:hypothetical protein
MVQPFPVSARARHYPGSPAESHFVPTAIAHRRSESELRRGVQAYGGEAEPLPNRLFARPQCAEGEAFRVFLASTLPLANMPIIAPPSQPTLVPGDVGEWLKPVPC